VSYQSNTAINQSILEYGKFVELKNDSRFPPVSVVRYEYSDTSTPGVSSVAVYPKTGLITYLANASDINLVLSASNVDIGDVGLIDHYTTGTATRAQIMRTGTIIFEGQSYEVGAVSVKTYGVSPVSGNVIVTNLDTYVNIITANQATEITLQKTLTANNATAANQVITNTLLNTVTANQATAANQTTTNTLLNTVTANQATEITLQKVLTGKDFATDTSVRALTSVTYTNIVTNTVAVSTTQTLPVSVVNPVTSVQVYTNSNTLAVSGNTAVTNTVAISTSQTLPVSVANIKQTVTNWDVLSAAINDTTYTTFPSNPANEITILNITGVYIFVKNSAKSLGIQIANNTSIDLKLVGNTNEVAVRSNNGDKTVYATFIAYS
jgi:hypothetical protein